jgi:hypothetical protein
MDSSLPHIEEQEKNELDSLSKNQLIHEFRKTISWIRTHPNEQEDLLKEITEDF